MRDDLVHSHGATLKTFTTGLDDLPTVLFVNAVGMEGELLQSIAAHLRSNGVNLVTWELRGSPGPADPRGCELSDHVADGLAVLGKLGIVQVHLAGWCTGASVALFLAHELGERALTFTSIDGAYLFDGVPGGPLGNAVFDMCSQIAEDVDLAERFHEITRPRGNEAAVLGIEDPDLVTRLTLPYRQGVEGLVRYACTIRSVTRYDPTPPCTELALPTLFAARRDDQMVSYRNSQRAAELVDGAQFVLADGGHYALFADDEVPALMTELILSSA